MSENASPTPENSAPAAPPESRPSFGERLSGAFLAFVRFVVRLLVILAVLGALGAAAYFGVPYLYRHYVQPVEDLQVQVATLQQQTARRAEEVNGRLLALQGDLAHLSDQQQALTQQLQQQQSDLDAFQARLDALEKQRAALAGQLDSLAQRVDAADANAAHAQATAEALQSAWAQWEGEIQAMQVQVAVLQALESLTRARVLLGQHNAGLAAEEIARAQATVAWLQKQPGANTDILQQAADQLTLAAKALPAAPAVAGQNLEAAWRLLSSLLPGGEATPTPTATGGPTEAPATPTPTPQP